MRLSFFDCQPGSMENTSIDRGIVLARQRRRQRPTASRTTWESATLEERCRIKGHGISVASRVCPIVHSWQPDQYCSVSAVARAVGSRV